MLEFNEDITQCVYKLRDRYKDKKNCVIMAYPIIEIIKFWKFHSMTRETSTKLFYSQATNSFEMQAPDQKFFSKISYYDYSMAERRWTRNMGHLFPLIRDLKICGLWNYISNKNLIIINEYNEKASPAKRQKVLNLILSD